MGGYIPQSTTISVQYDVGTHTVTNPFQGISTAWVEFILVSGGAGGRSGHVCYLQNDSSGTRYDGHSGGAGGVLVARTAASFVHGLNLVVGAGGSGGAAVTTSGTSESSALTGNSGTAGGATTLGTAASTFLHFTVSGGTATTNGNQSAGGGVTVGGGNSPVCVLWSGGSGSTPNQVGSNEATTGSASSSPSAGSFTSTFTVPLMFKVTGAYGGGSGGSVCGSTTTVHNGGGSTGLNAQAVTNYGIGVTDNTLGTSITAGSATALQFSSYAPTGAPGGAGGGAAHSSVAATANRTITGGAGARGGFPGGGGGGGGSASAHQGSGTFSTTLVSGHGNGGGDGVAIFIWHRE